MGSSSSSRGRPRLRDLARSSGTSGDKLTNIVTTTTVIP